MTREEVKAQLAKCPLEWSCTDPFDRDGEKVVDPAGYDWGFWEGDIVYRPDRYYLKVRLDNGDVTELKVDAVTYMHTNVGDRVKNR